MHTIADIAKRYDLPESTARYYCKRFRDFLPHVGEGKRRRYLPEALPVFEAVLKEMAESKNASMVEATLEKQFTRKGGTTPSMQQHEMQRQTDALPQAAVVADGSERFETYFRRQTEALENIALMLKELLQRHPRSVAIEDDTKDAAWRNEFQSELQGVQRSIESLRSMQDQAERIHQQDLDQLRKWLNHLAKDKTREG